MTGERIIQIQHPVGLIQVKFTSDEIVVECPAARIYYVLPLTIESAETEMQVLVERMDALVNAFALADINPLTDTKH